MQKLIFLSGTADCGKTTTLKTLIAMLLNLNNQHHVSVVYSSDKTRIQVLKTAGQNAPSLPDGEFSVVLMIDGILVGICTEGDRIGSVWNSVVFFEKHQCAIGILACHPDHLQRSMPCLVGEWSCHRIFDKHKVQNPGQYFQENRNMAQQLFDDIMTTMNCIQQSRQSANQQATANNNSNTHS